MSSDHPTADDAEGAESHSHPGRGIRLAAGLVGLEALGLLGLAMSELVNVNPDRPSVGITTAVFFALYAIGLGACARGLLLLRSWSRGPVVLAQLIELGVAWSFRGGSTTWVSILLAVPAVAVLAVVFSPSTTQALFGERMSDLEAEGGDSGPGRTR